MIYSERVRLRAIERDDLPRYVAWLNDPEVRQAEFHQGQYLDVLFMSVLSSDWEE
jgi:RimJ/RimL family protein N-acetyltransferase